MTDEKSLIEAVSVLSLQPDDILVVKHKGKLSGEQFQYMRKLVRDTFAPTLIDQNKIVCVDDSVSFEVVRREVTFEADTLRVSDGREKPTKITIGPVSIRPDGSLEFTTEYEPKSAAQEFWKAVSNCGVEVAAIVRDLANVVPLEIVEGGDCLCAMCDKQQSSAIGAPEEHEPHCVWLRARKLFGMPT